MRSGNHLYTGWVNRRGYVQIARYDLSSGRKKVVSLRPHLGTPDDHNNPSLVVEGDGRLTAYYSPHSGRYLPKEGVSRMYHRTTIEPGDISEWTNVDYVDTNSPGRMGYTYPNPVDLGSDRTWLAWRGGNWFPTYSVREASGWSRARTFINGTGERRPYAKFAPGPENSVLMSYNQAHPGKEPTNLYFLWYRPGRGYFRADGTKVDRDPAVIPADGGELVHSHRTYGRTWIMDLAADAAGNPVLLFTAGRNDRARVFYHSRWTGTRWLTRRIVSSGFIAGAKSPRAYGHYPTAGATLDHLDPSRVHLSRRVDGSLRVETWKLDGDTWTSRTISPPEKNCVRPVAARDDSDSGAIFMMCGTYRTWTRFNTAIYMALPYYR